MDLPRFFAGIRASTLVPAVVFIGSGGWLFRLMMAESGMTCAKALLLMSASSACLGLVLPWWLRKDL